MLTVQGYNQIIERIVAQPIDIPEGKTPLELIQYLYGYMAAQQVAIRVISDMKKGLEQK